MASPSTPGPLRREDYTFICHGCNIILKYMTRNFHKVEYVGPGRCIGCEFRTDDGYLIKVEAEEHMEKYRENTKKELFWEMSQQAAATRRQQ